MIYNIKMSCNRINLQIADTQLITPVKDSSKHQEMTKRYSSSK